MATFYVRFISGNALYVSAVSEKSLIKRLENEFSGYGDWVTYERI